MRTRATFGVTLLAIGLGIEPALSATASERDVSPPAPGASSSSSGQSMADMDTSSMPGMQMPAEKAAQKKPAPPRKGRKTSPAPASPAGMKRMKGMQGMGTGASGTQHTHKPTSPTQPTEMQHLHFGNMIGVRPRPGGLTEGMHGMGMSAMEGMEMGSMQGGSSPPNARSPDYSDGYRYTDMPGMAMSDCAELAMLYLDQLEYAHDNHGRSGAFFDADAWYGEDFNKLWVKAEGEYAKGALEDLRTEALWDHAITSYWDTQLGLRQDSGRAPGRTWAALGIQGLAPFWFDTEATFYVSGQGRTAARVQFEYEEPLTQRLVLQPKLEANFYGRSDPQRGIGAGLSDTELGVRLRLHFGREYGPYIGVVWRQRYGRSAEFARSEGYPASELQFVAGLHVWF